MKSQSLRCVAVLILLLSPSFALAQSNDVATNATSDDTQDPPTRVARLSYVDGSVSMQPGGTGEWGAASLNRPVTIGDKIWTDQNSKAELQAGEASIHLGQMTALSFLNLDGNMIQMRLAEGHINFRVRVLREGDVYEVDTPNAIFTVKQAGAFRIDVNENGDITNLTVLRGDGELVAAGKSYPVSAGSRADVNGGGADPQVALVTAADPDALDKWSQERDLKEDNSVAAKYVSRDVVGYSDLDDYGTWKQDPTYGNVWVPNSVPSGWAPYSNGNWSWVSPWGWTWVDSAPWGFAPFHYGRWCMTGGYWGWCPGPIYATPYYGPAYVGFYGGGWGWGFGIGIGVGWFPLCWGEPYHPWYHCGPTYWNHVNVNNTYFRNGGNVYSNNFHNYNYRYAHNPAAVSSVSHNGFVNGQAVHGNMLRVNESTLRNAHMNNNISATPTRSSYFGAANHGQRVSTPSASAMNRSVMARTAPGAAASQMPVQRVNNASLTRGQFNTSAARANPNSQMRPATTNSQNRAAAYAAGNPAPSRQSQLSSNRPPAAYGTHGMNISPNATTGAANNSPRPVTRTWNAQGNATDSGHAPQGFGTNRPGNGTVNYGANHADRPPWAQPGSTQQAPRYTGNSRAASENPMRGGTASRPPANYNGNRSSMPNYNNNRNYTPPNYNGNRGSSATPRSYSPPPSPRGYSSAPRGGGSMPHSSGAPSGGGYHGGAPSGGGSAHVGGGGGGHPHR